MANDVKVFQGDDHDIDVTVTDSDDNAIDVSNYDIFFTIKSDEDDADDDALLKKDQTLGSTSDTQSGKFTISLTNTETAGLDAGKHTYDIQWKDTSDNIRTVIKGNFIVQKDVTNRTS